MGAVFGLHPLLKNTTTMRKKLDKTTEELLEITFKKMPNLFSSNHFIRTAKKYGVDEYHLGGEKTSKFLKERCKQVGLRMWQKQNSELLINIFKDDNAVVSKLSMTDEMAIAHLKASTEFEYEIYVTKKVKL